MRASVAHSSLKQQQRPRDRVCRLLCVLLSLKPSHRPFLALALDRATACVTRLSMSSSPPEGQASSRASWLEGKRVLVTGGGRGIGRAIARVCDSRGARVALLSRTLGQLEEVSHALTNPSLALVADVTSPEQVRSAVDRIVEAWGGIDLLVNNAGVSQAAKGAFDTLDSRDLMRVLETNVVSVHIVSSTVVQGAMAHSAECEPDDKAETSSSSSSSSSRSGRSRGGCQIVNISSRAGKVGLGSYSFYSASKFALEGLTASMAEELKDRGIRVNSLSPGMVDTASFPKAPGRPGVRTAESVEDGFLAIVEAEGALTGHYLHVDELDAVWAKGLPDSAAFKPINEPAFNPK
jgi:3-oxoacyl-[acyl-carrier protein] reductase